MITKTGVVYLQKDKLQLYSPYLASIVEFRFVPEIVRDLDIVNKGLLENLIKVFLTNGKIPASNLIFVLSDNAYFVKDFTMQTPAPQPKASQPGQVPVQPVNAVTMENLKAAADKYIEHVPYDNVVSKTFPMTNGIKVCAVNQDFYEAVKGAFEKFGFTIDLVIPGLVLGNNLSMKPIMDAAMALGTIQKAGALKQYNLLTQQVFIPESEKSKDGNDEAEVEDTQPKKTNKKRLIGMIALLVVLVLILVVVFIQSQTPPKAAVPQINSQVPVTDVKQASVVVPNTPVPIVTAVQTASNSPTLIADQDTKNITVQIVNTSDTTSNAQNLKTDLMKYGFKSVTVQSQTGVGTSTTIVSFSTKIPQSVKTSVLDEVKKVKPNLNVQERPSDLIDISIILGNV